MSNLFLTKSVFAINQDLARGDLTVMDLVDTVRSAIDKHESQTHAWTCYDLEQIELAAKDMDRSKGTHRSTAPLWGMPFGIKDIFNTKTFPTEMGSPAWKGFTPGNNARVVDSLLYPGAMVVGKTVTAEFAVHELNETQNPHDFGRTPGTSSSGSAAAVATGMVPFALATQTAGSIARPASFCGIWGMKPSFGLIPRTGVLKTTDSLDSIGFVASHGKSLKPILDQVRVKGPDYPYVYERIDGPGIKPKDDKRPWRVGFVKTHVWDSACEYAKTAIEDLALRIAKEDGFEVDEIKWPQLMHSAHDVHSIIYAKSLAYYFQIEAEAGAQISNIMREMMAAGEAIQLQQFLNAVRQQDVLAQQLDSMLGDYDIVLSLGTASDAPLRDQTALPDPSLIWTLCHVPTVAVPTFRSPEGLPFGVQLVSRRWNDYLLLQGIEELIERGVLPKGSMAIEKNIACLS